jgi:hypothetical protein
MRCQFGNCKSDRDVVNQKTQVLYSYCRRHRQYQSYRQKQKRKLSKLWDVEPEEAVEPVEAVEAEEPYRVLEQRLAAYHKLFLEVDKIKDRLNALPESIVFTEKYVRDQLAAMVHGHKEHVLPTGDRIDVLTEEAIYEVKPPEQYKAAIGQLLVYSQFYPNHQKILYLTKISTPRKMATILRDCQRHGIFTQLFAE